MSDFLAVDWDAHEARYVLASISGRHVKLRAASTLRLVDVTEGAGEPQTNFGRSLAAALSEHKARRVKLLVSVPRSSIELLHITCPPATDKELPELVANLAMQQSATISEQWILDFVPTDEQPSAPRQVTAAALPPEERERIAGECAAAGLQARRMLLRPLASASLLLRLIPADEAACLALNRMGCEADLNLVARGRVVFSRTVRLPDGADEAEVAGRLIVEINRTLAAAPRDRLGDQPVRSVYVFGGPGDYELLFSRIADELSLTARRLDPLAAVDARRVEPPADRGRFAALVGMLLDEAHGSHALDFLHPRKPPRPVSRLRLGLIGGGAAAAAVLAVAFQVWTTLSGYHDRNRDLAARLKQLNETAKKAVVQKKLIEEIDGWKRSEVNWLDELRDLSIRFPGSRDAVVTRMALRSASSGGGAIALEGLVRDPKVVLSLERQIRDPYHTVRSPRGQTRPLEDDYTWFFEASIAVAPRSKDLYVSHLPQPAPAPDEADVEPDRDARAMARAAATAERRRDREGGP